METSVNRYYELKRQQKEIEEEIEAIRKQLLEIYPQNTAIEIGPYQVKVSYQERREYDDHTLYNALPDASLWRLLSKADGSKISSLLKLNVIHEEVLAGTFKIKQVPYIQVTKK